MKKQEKLVTNLMLNICKLRDILETRDFETIRKNLHLFMLVSNDVERQLGKYIRHTSHNLDFTYEDLKALSDEAFDFIQNYQQKFLFSKYQKELLQYVPITSKILNDFNENLGHKMRVDTDLREFYKRMSHYALMLWLWINSDDKKTIDVMLIDTLRSFLT